MVVCQDQITCIMLWLGGPFQVRKNPLMLISMPKYSALRMESVRWLRFGQIEKGNAQYGRDAYDFEKTFGLFISNISMVRQ
jgi:hypothetical protein